MPTFDFTPSYATGGTFSFKTHHIEMGDGYAQRSKSAINNRPLKYNVRFSNKSVEEIRQIDAFLAAMAGVTSFEWTPPTPHDYSNAVEWDSEGGYSKGELANDGDGNVYTSLIDSNSQPLTDTNSWVFLAKVPMKFICREGNWTLNGYESTSLDAVFEQVFDL